MEDRGHIALDWAYLIYNTEIDDSLNCATTATSSSKKSAIASGFSYKCKNGEGKPTDMDCDTTLPTIILHHGLCGDSTSEHIIHLAERFLTDERRRYRVVVVVARGCGELVLNTEDAMNGARTTDLKEAINHVKKLLPHSPLYGMGFSLGAGLMLKYLGVEGPDTKLQVSFL